MLRKAILSQFTQAKSTDLDDGAEPDPELSSLADVHSDDDDDLSIDPDHESSDVNGRCGMQVSYIHE